MRAVALPSFATVMILGFLSVPALARQAATVTETAAIYAKARVSTTPLRTAAIGTKLKVVKDAGEWLQVEFNDPQSGLRRGWVQKKSVSVSSETLTPMDLSVPATPAPARRIAQVCGIVVSCHEDSATIFTLLVQPGISVAVEAKTARDAEAFRPMGTSVILQKACLTGRLLARQNENHLARFLVETTDAIALAGPAPVDWSPTDVYTSCDKDVTAPTIKGKVPQPNYTRDAMDHHIAGRAVVQALVGVDGVVENVRLLKSLDPKFGLDQEAVKCARTWTFNPATKNGVAVRMAVTIELSFTLKG
jgi:TonB family protein